MKKLCVYLFIAVVFVFFAQAEILACSCVPRSNEPLKTQVRNAKSESKAVFTARVVRITKNSKNGFVTVKLRLIKSWKGKLSKNVTLFTGLGGGDCGYPFKAGTTYLIYAYSSGTYSTDENKLETNICSRTTKAADARAEIELLNVMNLPKDKINN